jgi:PIN domain nuclease of toxin-antitoxin system
VVRCVLDASALLALLHAEPGADTVEEAAEESVISAVNWSEVVQRLHPHGVDARELRNDVSALGIAIVPFTAEDAEETAAYWTLARSHGLSLGDRACLGLARRLGVPALTADRAWADTDTGVTVRVIR